MKIKTTNGNVSIEIDTSRFDSQFNKAQIRLNTLVVADCTPYIPFSQGQLRSQVDFPHGISGDEVRWYAPYAHYQYMGEVYGPNIPRKDAEGNIIGWFSPPQKYPTGRDLQYHTPGTGAFWFEEAKEQHCQQWVDVVRREGLK